jgi:hypothetical protein
MPLPEELHMQTLEDLRPNQGTLILNLGLAGGGPRDDLLRRHFVNYIRLVDLSVAEYERARRFLRESLPGQSNRLGASLSAIDHLELCVITVRRALNALRAVARNSQAPAIPRDVRRALESFEGPLCDVRDSVVHIEERISRGDLQKGDSHALLVDTSGRTASIGKETISLERLGTALRRLHGVACELSSYRESEQLGQ